MDILMGGHKKDYDIGDTLYIAELIKESLPYVEVNVIDEKEKIIYHQDERREDKLKK